MNKKTAPFFVALFLLAIGAWGFLQCSAEKASTQAQNTTEEASAKAGEESNQAAATPPAPIDPETAGSIRGVVHFDGVAPARKKVSMAGTAECIGLHKDLPEAENLLVENGKLQNVVVSVRRGLEGRKFEAPKEPAVLDQIGCIYNPHVVGMQVGQELKILNSDPLAHNIWPDSKVQSWENLMMAKKGSELLFKAKKAEITALRCGIHSWMKCQIAIFSHPYFSITGKDGAFEIQGLPPGKYTLRAWHEELGTQDLEVTLEAKGNISADFRFKK